MTKWWNIPITYEPKIQAVINRECHQIIRAGQKLNEEDKIAFHGWEGKPCRSKWSWRTPYYTVTLAEPIIIYRNGICLFKNNIFWEWDHPGLNNLAYYDHIVPSTGIELGMILMNQYKIPEKGLPAQIIWWF